MRVFLAAAPGFPAPQGRKSGLGGEADARHAGTLPGLATFSRCSTHALPVRTIATMADQHPLEDVLRRAIRDTDGDKTSIGDLMDLYGQRSFGPVFTLLGLLTVAPPLGAIPGLPAAVGVVILLFSAQILSGRRHIWLPRFLEDLSIGKDRLETAHDKSKGILRRIDGLVTDRLEWAAGDRARYGSAVLVSLMALLMIPLELVPFAVALPGAAITMVGLALTARDGALMLLAYALAGTSIFVLLRYSPVLGWLGL